MPHASNSVTLHRLRQCLTTIESSGHDLVNRAVGSLSTIKDPLGRYLVLDLLDVLFQSGLTNVDYLGPYTVPDVPIGQSWYSWKNLEYVLRMGVSSHTPIMPIVEDFLSDPSTKSLGNMSALIRLHTTIGWSRGPTGMEMAIPRLLACQDYRRGAFLYPDDPGYKDTTICATLIERAMEGSYTIRPRTLIGECLRRMNTLCDHDIDPTVTWNRVSLIGTCLYLFLIHKKLQALCPQDASVVMTALYTHTEILTKELPHEQSAF